MNRALFVLLMLISPVTFAGITGSYSGSYQCGGPRALLLQVTDEGRGRLQAVFTFNVDRQNPNGERATYLMEGTYDERTGRFVLEPQRWIGAAPRGMFMVGMAGVFDTTTRHLQGKMSGAMCGGFDVAPGSSMAVLPSSALPPRASTAGSSPMASPSESVPPAPAAAAGTSPEDERRRQIAEIIKNRTLPVGGPAGTEYWDAAMSDAPGTVRESEPIDDVIDWLKKNNFSCKGSQHVSWDSSGTRGTVNDEITVRERFVIECDGNCRGVRYIPYTDAAIYPFGHTQPVPVLEMKSVWLGGQKFNWIFTRPGGSPPPDIWVHRWTISPFNSGGNCRAPKSNNN